MPTKRRNFKEDPTLVEIRVTFKIPKRLNAQDVHEKLSKIMFCDTANDAMLALFEESMGLSEDVEIHDIGIRTEKERIVSTLTNKNYSDGIVSKKK